MIGAVPSIHFEKFSLLCCSSHPRAAAGANQARRKTRRNAVIFIGWARASPSATRQLPSARARLERVQAQRLHEAGPAGALAERGHSQERVADDDAQAELGVAACGDAGDPRGVRAQPPAVDEAEQGVGEGEAGDARRDLGAGGLVLERGRRDADVGAAGVHRDEQAAVGAGDDAELDDDLRRAVAGAEAQAGRSPADDVEGAVGGRRRLLGRAGGGVLCVGHHRSSAGARRGRARAAEAKTRRAPLGGGLVSAPRALVSSSASQCCARAREGAPVHGQGAPRLASTAREGAPLGLTSTGQCAARARQGAARARQSTARASQ